MAFCTNCGAQVDGSFCPNCGTPVAAPAGAGSSAGAAYAPPPPRAAAAPGLSENTASALCYLFGFVTGIIFLVLSPYNTNKTVRFHAFQSIFASIGVIIVSILLSILMGALFFTHGFWMGFLVHRLWDLAVFVGWLYMMYTAYSNKKVKIPVVGDLAEKQA